MSSNSFGKLFTITTYGESHGPAIGLIIDGCPAGIPFDLDFIQSELDRRRPGGNTLGTKRDEGDKVELLSGVFEGLTTGCPIAMEVRNQDQKSKDYSDIQEKFRPGHADYTYFSKYGIRDFRGGGRSSGRETLARVAGGAVAKLLLQKEGISISAGTVRIGNIKARTGKWEPPFNNELSCPDKVACIQMVDLIRDYFNKTESVGGIIECHARGVPAGLGEPCFDKLDARLAAAMLSIGACKGFEIGSGFNAATMKGSEHNDEMYIEDGKPAYRTNNAGGVLGGISNGNEIVFRCAFKPTASISQLQHTIDTSLEECEILVKGRHDPCIVPRAVVVVEAMCALVLADCYLEWRAYGL